MRSRLPLVLGGAALGLMAVLAVALLMTMRHHDSSGTLAATASAATPKVTPTHTKAKPVPSKAAAHHGTVSVSSLPAGLFCRDLHKRGYSYVAAVDYWRQHGEPNQMDVDRNGIPCETVYSRADVSSYWSSREPGGLPVTSTGLLCRDLMSDGFSYSQAVAYWYWQGQPSRMDADSNGIPCETVYPSSTVGAYWNGW